MTYEEWWDREDYDSVPDSDFTFGEVVWKASQRDAWEAVFQIVSDQRHPVSREFVKELEAAREEAGAGLAQVV